MLIKTIAKCDCGGQFTATGFYGVPSFKCDKCPTVLMKPFWATELSTGYTHVGSVLATRDGRRRGNGIVTKVEDGVIHVSTDFGNVMRLTEDEAKGAFYHPLWVSDIQSWRDSIVNNHAKAKWVKEDSNG